MKKIHRFIIKNSIESGLITISDPDFINQVHNVLKLKTGGDLILCDGKGYEASGEIIKFNKNEVQINVGNIIKNQNEPSMNTSLYCAILKKENFELVVQKATEIGIKTIIPIITERTVKLDIRKDRLEKIIKEATEQSERGLLPILENPVDFKTSIENTTTSEINFLFDRNGTKLNPPTYNPDDNINIWIGPEGGWTNAEIEKAKNTKFHITTLGTTILRAETAAIAASYTVVNMIP